MRMSERLWRQLFSDLGLLFEIGKKQLNEAIRIRKKDILNPVLFDISVIYFGELWRKRYLSVFFRVFPAVFDPNFRTVGIRDIDMRRGDPKQLAAFYPRF